MNFDQLIMTILGTLVGGLILWILLFPFRQFISKRPERKKELEKKLRTHFEDMKREVINHISEMARSLTIRNNRLVFGSYAPVSESYNFEGQESYECFKVHFKEMNVEWKQLKGRALKHQEWLEALNAKDRRIGIMEALQEQEYPLADKFDFEEEMERHEASNDEFIDSYIHLEEDFKDFAMRVAREIESISKYEIGKKFKKHKNAQFARNFNGSAF